MINTVYKIAIALGMLTVAGTASATPIKGSIGFTGSYSILNGGVATSTFTTGNEIAISTASITGNISGSFADEGINDSSIVNYANILYSPTSAIDNLWSVGSFTFDLSAMSIDYISDANIVLSGWGTISSTNAGLDNSYGAWNFSANSGGTNFTWSNSTVPEPSVVMLLGFGLLGMVGASRRKRR